MYAPDLTKHAPRSLRTRLGGYAILPRLLDKCRATIMGTAGDYHFNCPLDQLFLEFVGIAADEMKAEIAMGNSDGEMLEWVNANSLNKPTAWEVETWSLYQDGRCPEPGSDLYVYFMDTLKSHSATRGDVRSWAELLDLDDYCSFGGAA